MLKLLDDEDLEPMEVAIRCPNCGEDFPPKGPIDRRKRYECPGCHYEFSFIGPLPEEP